MTRNSITAGRIEVSDENIFAVRQLIMNAKDAIIKTDLEPMMNCELPNSTTLWIWLDSFLSHFPLYLRLHSFAANSQVPHGPGDMVSPSKHKNASFVWAFGVCRKLVQRKHKRRLL